MELNLTLFDYGIIAVLLVSTVYGFFRGLTREIFSLATWFLSFWISKLSVGYVSIFLSPLIISSRLRLIMAFVLILIICLFLFHFVTVKLSRLVKSSALTGMDRALGSFFGMGRGILITALLVVVLSPTEIGIKSQWQNAQLRFPLEVIASFLQLTIPEVEWAISPK